MKFSVATVLAFAAAVMAKPEFTNLEFNVVEGKPFTLTWIKAEGKIKLELMSGPNKDGLKPIQTIANLPAGSSSFDYTPSNLPPGNYAFRITDENSGSDPSNYTELFSYTGTGTVSSSTGGSTTGSATRTSTAASSAETETETTTDTDTATQTSTTGSQSTSATGSATTTMSTTTTRTSTTASRSATGTPPSNTNNGQRLASSLALVLGTVAALVFFN